MSTTNESNDQNVNHVEMLRQVLQFADAKNINNTQDLVKAYNEEAKEKEENNKVNSTVRKGLRFWLDEYLKDFTNSSLTKFAETNEAFVRAFDCLTEVKDDEFQLDIWNSLHRKIGESRHPELSLLNMTITFLHKVDTNLFVGDATKFVQLAQMLLLSLQLHEKLIGSTTYHNYQSLLAVFHQGLLMTTCVDPRFILDHQYQDLIKHLNNLICTTINCSCKYQLACIKKSLLRMQQPKAQKRTKKWTKKWKCIKYRSFAVINSIQIIQCLTLEGIIGGGPLDKFKNNMRGCTRKNQSIVDRPSSTWLAELSALTISILTGDEEADLFFVSIQEINNKLTSTSKLSHILTIGEWRALRYGVIHQCRALALQDDAGTVGIRCVDQLNILAGDEAWIKDAEIFTELLDTLSVIAASSKLSLATAAKEALMNRISSIQQSQSGLSNQKTVIENWLAGQTLDERMLQYHSVIMQARPSNNDDTLFMNIQQKLNNATNMTSDILTDYLPITLVRSYVERKMHVMEIDEILQENGLCILCGESGSGKSTLAMHYALKQQRDSIERKEWPFLVVRIIQEVTKTNLLHELQRTGRELDINTEIIKKETKQDIQKYCRELTKLIYNQLVRIGQRLILILDNPQDSSVLEDCNHYRGGLETTVQLFVTTRNHDAFFDHKESQITLSTFTYEEGQEYLKKRLKSHQKWQNEDRFKNSAYKLITTVGRTPLRLKLASGYLQENRFMTIDEYVDMHRISNPPEGVLPEVQIGLEALDSMSQLMMHYSTKLQTSYIPFDLFEHLFKVEKKELKKKIIDPLERLSLVTVLLGRDGDNGNGIQIHDEVRASCGRYKEWQGEAKMSEESLLNHIVSTVSQKMPFVKSVGDDNWRRAELYAPQGEKVIDGAENVLGNDKSLAILCSCVGQYERLLCNFQQCLIYQEKGLKIEQQLFGDKPHPNVAQSLNNIGSTYFELGDIQKALDCYQQSLKMKQQIQGDTPHLDVAASLNNIGMAYYNLGNNQTALEYHEKALRMKQEIYGEKPHSDISQSLNNIGNAYYNLGNIPKALEYHEKVLKIRQEIYGDKPHPYVVRSLNNIGLVYYKLGHIRKGLEYHKRSLTMEQQLYGDKPHLDVAASLSNIGNAYNKMGDIRKGLEYHLKAFKMREQVYGDKPHSGVADSLHNIGSAYSSLGDIQRALEYHERALKIRQEIYGGTPHVHIVKSLYWLGDKYEELGKKDIAKQYFQKGLAISQELSPSYATKTFVNAFKAQLWDLK